MWIVEGSPKIHTMEPPATAMTKTARNVIRLPIENDTRSRTKSTLELAARWARVPCKNGEMNIPAMPSTSRGRKPKVLKSTGSTKFNAYTTHKITITETVILKFIAKFLITIHQS